MSRITAKNVLSRYWDGFLPVDVSDIANAMGIDVVYGDGTMPGSIEILPNGQQLITVNPNDSNLRQRFTIAHEIAHSALGHLGSHRHLFRETQETIQGNTNSHLETAANQFAAELLMPEFVLRYVFEEENITDVNELAQKFAVSIQAMYYRLKNLYLI